MRTTLSIDEDVLDWARELARRADRPFRRIINDAVRQGLSLAVIRVDANILLSAVNAPATGMGRRSRGGMKGCPASLGRQWAAERREKLHLPVRILDTRASSDHISGSDQERIRLNPGGRPAESTKGRVREAACPLPDRRRRIHRPVSADFRERKVPPRALQNQWPARSVRNADR